MDLRMFLVVLGLVARTFGILDLEFAKEYNSKEGSVRRKPELRLDEAWLTINSSVNFNILLFSLNDQCWKCDPVFVDIIPRFSIYTLKVNTTYGTTIYLKENDLTGTLDETFCTFHKKFTESGDYWVFVSNQEFIHHDCKLLQTNDPLPAEMPILYVFGGLLIIWVIGDMVVRLDRKYNKSQSVNITDPENAPRNLRMKSLRPTQNGFSDISEDSGTAHDRNNSPQQYSTHNKRERLKSLDTFRGLSLMIMVFVNYGGGGYWFFDHPPWNGITVADLVFPWFIFIMGTAMNYSFRGMMKRGTPRYRMLYKVLRRAILLFFIGIVLNTNWGPVNLKTIRIPGVLQRFSLTYLVLGLFEVCFSRYDTPEKYQGRCWSSLRDILLFLPQWFLALGILAAYVCLTFLLPIGPCPTGYIGPGGLHDSGKYYNCTAGAAAYIDIMVLGKNHIYGKPTPHIIYQTTTPHDPEGILGTLSSIFLCFLGLQSGRILIYYLGHASRVVRWLIWAIITGAIGGTLCKFSINDGWIPLNKNLWSVSFIMVTACFAFILLAILYLIIDVTKIWNGTPFIFPGMNSLVVYVCHDVFYRFFPVNWYMENPMHWHLLLKAVWDTAIWVVLAYILYRKRIFIAL